MKFKMFEICDDGSRGEHLYSQTQIKSKFMESVNTGCVKVIEVYTVKGKQPMEKVLIFKRFGNTTPWELKKVKEE